MRYRKLSASGDMQFGRQENDFWINQPEAPAQAVWTRLQLQLGTWFQDVEDGTDWKGQILGNRTTLTRDAEIKSRAMLTQGVSAIDNYSSTMNPDTRKWSAGFNLETVYGPYKQLTVHFIEPTASPVVMPIKPQTLVVAQTGANTVQVTWQPPS